MNSWRLNGIAGHVTRYAIAEGLGIEHTDIYKEVKSMTPSGIIETKDGKKYKLELKEIK